MNKSRNILIVRTDRIGDVVLTLPLVTALKRHNPAISITMLISHYTAEVVQSYQDKVETLYYDNTPFFEMVKILKQKKFDAVIVVKPSWRSALLFFVARIPVRIGTGYRLYSFLFNNKIYEHRKTGNKHELEYNLNLLAPFKAVPPDKIIPKLTVDSKAKEKVESLLKEKGLKDRDTLIILHPGSGGSSRTWDWKHFGELGKRLAGLSNVKVLVSGGMKEKELIHNVSHIIGEHSLVLDETLSIKEFIALISLAKLFVVNSTGPLHLAAAVGTKVVAFFPQIPSLSAVRWGPVTENKLLFQPKNKPLDCAKCISANECECMNSILIDDVFEEISNVL